MASYDGGSFDRMQREAAARAWEMQKRARAPLHGEGSAEAAAAANAANAAGAAEAANAANAAENSGAQSAFAPGHGAKKSEGSIGALLSSLLGSDFRLDEEKALIGMLIYILYKNGCDVKLMLALGYLLL